MPRIWIDVDRSFDWEVTDEVDPAEVESGAARQNASGDWTRRVTNDAPATTSISIPEAQVDELLAFSESNPDAVWGGDSREEVIALLVSRLVMPKHARRADWTDIRTDEPVLTAVLRRHYGLPRQPSLLESPDE